MKCSTVYIAGPMRGYPRYNFDAFDDAAKRWREWGHQVISPAEMDRDAGFDPDTATEPTPAGMRQCIKRDLLAIIHDCDAIALLPGWEQSAGVKVEKALAEFLGLSILDATTGQPRDASPDPEIDRVVTLEVGQVFTSGDAAIVRLARSLHSAGAEFSFQYKFQYKDKDKDWQSPDGRDLEFVKNFAYRLDRLPVDTSDRQAVLYGGLAWYDSLEFSASCTARCEAARTLWAAGWNFQAKIPPRNGWESAAGTFACQGARYRVDGVPEWWIADRVREQHSTADESILDEAIRITSGDRQASYGPPDQDFRRCAAMWSQLLGVGVESRQVAMCMIALKLSRETHQRKRDNWVDIAGYAKCGSLCE